MSRDSLADEMEAFHFITELIAEAVFTKGAMFQYGQSIAYRSLSGGHDRCFSSALLNSAQSVDVAAPRRTRHNQAVEEQIEQSTLINHRHNSSLVDVKVISEQFQCARNRVTNNH